MKQIFICFFLVTIISCTSDNEQDYFGLDCDTENVYYTSSDSQKSISHIIATKCLSCHSNETMSVSGSWVPLEDYDELSSYLDLDEIINNLDSPMPPVGHPPLTDCEQAQIESWVHNGFLYEED